MSLLKLVEVGHSFDYPLFNDINISLNEKESIAITGVSGKGKSTLLHIGSTFLKPNYGKVYIENSDIYNNLDNLNFIRRHKIAIIFQSHYLFNGLSTKENLQISSLLTNGSIDKKLLQALKIDNLINRDISSLSGGQKQRFSIARALIKKPKIIFADEPTGNLDNDTAVSVMQYLFEYINTNNASLFIVTHDLKIAKQCSKKLVI